MANEIELTITSKDKTSSGFKSSTDEATKYGGSIAAVGEKADNSERNLIGLHDVIDGTATIMQGPGKQGIAAYIQGWADLAGGIAPLLISLSQLSMAQIASTANKAKDLAVTIAHSVATKAAAVASGIWTAAQWLLNIALDANPIGLVILAIAALVGVIILIATKTTWFQNIWKHVWDFMKGVGAWFAGPFADFFVGAWNKITGFFSGIGGAISGAFHGAIGFVKQGINGIIYLANKALEFINNNLIGGLNKIPGVNLPSLRYLPYLASGGITGSGWAVVGERGRELIKTSPGTQVMNNGDTERFLSGAGVGGAETIVVELRLPDGSLLEANRRIVKSKGGSVQLTFGR